MKKIDSIALASFLVAFVAACEARLVSAQEPAKVDFVRDVQPLFKAHCTSCHGAKQQKNGLRLDRRRDALRGGVANQIAPGNSEASHLFFRLVGDRDGLQMPPDGPLASEQIKVVKAWIDQGAEWPDEASGETPPPPSDPMATRLMDLLREGDRAAFRELLRSDPKSATLKGLGGSTPLMYATLYGDAESVRLLLEDGSDPNIRNDAGATALMWGVDNLDCQLNSKTGPCQIKSPALSCPYQGATFRLSLLLPENQTVVRTLPCRIASQSHWASLAQAPVPPRPRLQRLVDEPYLSYQCKRLNSASASK